MSWLKKLTKRDEKHVPVVAPAEKPLTDNLATVPRDAFKSHWRQICEVINNTNPRFANTPNSHTNVLKIESITANGVAVVRNLFEQMIFMLVEEQSSGDLYGPILDFAITQDVFEKLYEWWNNSSSYKEEMMLNLLRVYEVLISQAQHSLLHHKQLIGPMLKLLSSTYGQRSKELEDHIVLLLNLLCVWLNRDPSLMAVFFNASANNGPAKFLIFSLLIEYVHREGSVGQQARDALLLCMALSAENSDIASYITQNSNFCPVLAVGLSGIYSTLPRKLEVRADDWHCLQRNEWSHIPELTNFMNSFEFCNSVIEVAAESVSEQLLDFFYNGFLVSVFGPSLHKKDSVVQNETKTAVNEVVVTTAYLNLFLRTVTAPGLMKCFLRFLLTYRHEDNLIITTLTQRVASSNRLALVSLSLIRTLIDLNCEDLLLQLVLRHLIPCQHILPSQRCAIRDVDIHNASASRFLALTPAVCCEESGSEKEEEMFLPVQSIELEPKQAAKNTPKLSSEGYEVTTELHSIGNDSFHTPMPQLHETMFAVPLIHSRLQTNLLSSPISNDVHSEYTVNEDLSVTVNMHSDNEEIKNPSNRRSRTITSPSTMAEFGPDLKSQLELNTSYMDYLEDAKNNIDQCSQACLCWSAPYDGIDPAPEKNENDPAGIEQPCMKTVPVQDSVPLQASETAIKALSATYQALNLTALALNGPDTGFEKFPDITQSCLQTSTRESKSNIMNDDCGQPCSVGKLPVEDIHASSATEICVEDLTVTGSDILTSTPHADTGGGAKATMLKSSAMKDSEDASYSDLELNHITKEAISISTGEEEADMSSNRHPSLTSSSVDEFFRSLMEIVPKGARDQIEDLKSAKVNAGHITDEDIESGIEVSSEGDIQNVISQHNITDGEDYEESSPQNADSMSQLSLNTDEIEKIGEEAREDEHSNFDSIENNTSHYSFAYDTDDEFDDTTSVASSSFYEAGDEYSPTEISVIPETPLRLQGMPYTGPLIGTLFAKLDLMVSNSLYENLLLTGIVTRLAAYPQPLLRSFLLNTHMVFHPRVRSLYQVLNSARNKIDMYALQVTDFKVLVRRAQKYLLARGTFPFSGDARTRNIINERPMPVPKVNSRALGNIFARRKPRNNTTIKSLLPRLETLLERRGRSSSKDSKTDDTPAEDEDFAPSFSVKQETQTREREERKMKELRTKNAVYACIVLAEFLKELAAVAQEHAVAGIA